MKKIQKQILSGTAALSMGVLQFASIAPLQVAAKSSGRFHSDSGCTQSE